jgi:hypothetical protein
MKQIATFNKVEDAEMLRAFLEGAGIAANVRDGHTVTADWALSNAIGGAKVDVEDEDVGEAIALLRDFQVPYQKRADAKPKARHKLSRYAKIAAALFGIILLLIASTIGFRGDVAPEMLVISAGGIALGVASFAALYDL